MKLECVPWNMHRVSFCFILLLWFQSLLSHFKVTLYIEKIHAWFWLDAYVWLKCYRIANTMAKIQVSLYGTLHRNFVTLKNVYPWLHMQGLYMLTTSTDVRGHILKGGIPVCFRKCVSLWSVTAVSCISIISPLNIETIITWFVTKTVIRSIALVPITITYI